MSNFNQGNSLVNTLINSSNTLVLGNTSTGTALTVQQLGAGNVFSFSNAAGFANVMVMNNLGQVGIGTTSPTQVSSSGTLLHVYDNSGNSPTVRIDATGSIGQARLHLSAGNGATYRASRVDFFNFPTSTTVPAFTLINDYDQNGTNNFDFVNSAGTRMMSLKQNGNVGIGIASPTAQLHVYQSTPSGFQMSINNVANSGGSNYSAFIHSDQAYCGGVLGAGQYTYSGSTLLVTSYPNNTSNNSGYTAYFGTSANDATSLAPQMVIKAATGNVGIGTNNPRSKLVVENGNVYLNYDTYSNCFIGGGPSGVQGQSYVGFTYPGEYDTHSLEFGCHSTLTAYFKRNYNDGINQFNILSNVFVNPQFFNGPALAVRPQSGGSTGPIVQFSNIGGGSNTFIMNNLGQVGIGTTNPGSPLEVVSSAVNAEAIPLYLRNNATQTLYNVQSVSMIFGPASGSGAGTGGQAKITGGLADAGGGGYLAFSTYLSTSGYAERMRILSTGNVGIGTTNPGALLDVYGTTNGTSTTTGCITNSGGSLNLNAGVNAVYMATGGVTRTYQNASSFAPQTDNAYTNGANGARWSAIWAASGTINTSDAREKANIASSNLGLNFISNLNPVSYTWKVGQNIVDAEGNVTPRPGKRTFYGFLAQDVKKTLDSLGTGDFAGWTLDDPNDPNSTQGLRYTEFIAPMVKAVQELSALVQTQQTTISSLEQSLATATANFSSLEQRLAAAGL